MIIPYDECKSSHSCGENCPYQACPNGIGKCGSCQTHCPCCSGARYGLCVDCPEPDCANRNAEYIP